MFENRPWRYYSASRHRKLDIIAITHTQTVRAMFDLDVHLRTLKPFTFWTYHTCKLCTSVSKFIFDKTGFCNIWIKNSGFFHHLKIATWKTKSLKNYSLKTRLAEIQKKRDWAFLAQNNKFWIKIETSSNAALYHFYVVWKRF